MRYFVSKTDPKADFSTLEEAVAAAAKAGEAAEICLDEGRFELSRSVTVDFDGLTITGVPGKTTVSAGRLLKGAEKVSDPAVLSRLPEEAREHVLVVDLEKNGLTEYPAIGLGPLPSFWGNYPTGDRPDEGPGMELFSDGRAMVLARYPNEGFIKIEKATGETPRPSIIEWDNNRCRIEGKFIPKDKRPLQWKEEKDIILHGYWAYEWAPQRQKVKSIDADTCEITVEEPYHSNGYANDGHFFAMNLLCELDEPGEWYLDRENRKLYYYPLQDADTPVTVTVVDRCIQAKGVTGLRLENITFEESRDVALLFEGCKDVEVTDCVIRNTGCWAVIMEDCRDSEVSRCEIYGTAGGGVKIAGGCRDTLTPSGLVVSECDIHHVSRWHRVYVPPVLCCGVGCRVTGNKIHDVPHMAIGFHGNDHVIERNEIYNAVFESNDAGAIYAGRDWSCYGNEIRYNYIHDCQGFENKGCMGIYLDDAFSSVYIHHNLFQRVYFAVFLGGGRDNVVEANVFEDCDYCVHVDNRLENWAAFSIEDTMIPRLKAVPYTSRVWKNRYPTLPGLLDEQPEKPLGTKVIGNTCYNSVWTDTPDEVREEICMEDNRQMFPREARKA